MKNRMDCMEHLIEEKEHKYSGEDDLEAIWACYKVRRSSAYADVLLYLTNK